MPRSPAASERGLTFPVKDRVKSGYVIIVRGFNNTYILMEVQQPSSLCFSEFGSAWSAHEQIIVRAGALSAASIANNHRWQEIRRSSQEFLFRYEARCSNH